jgi:mRNA interferase YafQ
MRRPVRTNRFKKDIALARKRGKNLDKLRGIMKRLIAEEPLDARHRNHPLTGTYSDRQECHIEPDWLLIYKLEDESIIFERTGTHSDLFR